MNRSIKWDKESNIKFGNKNVKKKELKNNVKSLVPKA